MNLKVTISLLLCLVAGAFADADHHQRHPQHKHQIKQYTAGAPPHLHPSAVRQVVDTVSSRQPQPHQVVRQQRQVRPNVRPLRPGQAPPRPVLPYGAKAVGPLRIVDARPSLPSPHAAARQFNRFVQHPRQLPSAKRPLQPRQPIVVVNPSAASPRQHKSIGRRPSRPNPFRGGNVFNSLFRRPSSRFPIRNQAPVNAALLAAEAEKRKDIIALAQFRDSIANKRAEDMPGWSKFTLDEVITPDEVDEVSERKDDDGDVEYSDDDPSVQGKTDAEVTDSTKAAEAKEEKTEDKKEQVEDFAIDVRAARKAKAVEAETQA